MTKLELGHEEGGRGEGIGEQAFSLRAFDGKPEACASVLGMNMN